MIDSKKVALLAINNSHHDVWHAVMVPCKSELGKLKAPWIEDKASWTCPLTRLRKCQTIAKIYRPFQANYCRKTSSWRRSLGASSCPPMTVTAAHRHRAAIIHKVDKWKSRSVALNRPKTKILKRFSMWRTYSMIYSNGMRPKSRLGRAKLRKQALKWCLSQTSSC